MVLTLERESVERSHGSPEVLKELLGSRFGFESGVARLFRLTKQIAG
jgi:hypothetical protein